MLKAYVTLKASKMLKWLTWAIPLKAQRNKDENYADSKCKPTSPGRRFVESGS